MILRSSAAAALVSVVTPCFNGEEFIRDTIESVLSQSHAKIELVVVDDGSTDDSWEIIESYGDRVTAVRKQNGGVPSARNAGVRHARGDSILFLDADDLIAPDTVEALLEARGESAGDLAVCPWRRLARAGDGWAPHPPEIPAHPPGADHLRLWLEGRWLPVHSILWPRDLFERLGGFDETLSANEDGDLALRALARGARLRMTPRGEALYRTHGESRVSISRDVFSADRLLSRQRVLEKLTEELRATGRWEAYREPVGVAYHRLAVMAFQDQPELGRELLRTAELYSGRRAVSRTPAGRLLSRMVGVERKERIVATLAHWGVMTAERRRVARHRELHGRDAIPGTGASPPPVAEAEVVQE